MFCFHKYGPVDERNMQYCSKCGKARVVQIPCNHNWVIIKRASVKQWERVVGEVMILQCSHCGDVKEFKVEIEN